MKPKVLLLDDFHPSLTEGLEAAGFDVIDDQNCAADLNFIVERLAQIAPEGLMVRSKIFVGEEILKSSPGLRWVGRGGAGMDNLDVVKAESLGIHCFNAGEANADAVGEHTMAMLLGLFTNLVKAHREVVDGKWDREGNRGVELKGKTVGILGFGNTGSAVAKRLTGFGVRVLAHDKYRTGFSCEGIEEVDEATLLKESDVLTLHVPLTGETQHWLNTERLSQMKPAFWLLNLSRGKVLDLNLVMQGLVSGRILGFAADVLPVEPPLGGDSAIMEIFNLLRENNRVILSPHIGGWTVESYRKISEVLLDKVLKLYDIPKG